MREVVQDVRILHVLTSGDDVLVDLYGSKENLCGSVRFTFAKASARRRHVRLLQRWAEDETPVTLVTDDDTVALVNDRSLFDRLLDPTA